MSSPAPFEPIAKLLERNLSIRHVYGEPVQRVDTTVIPVAQVVYGFGAGGGGCFVRFHSLAPWVLRAAVGLVVGVLLARRHH